MQHTIEAVLERMRSQIGSWEAAGDRRAVFLACYALMTANMARAIGAGRFRDAPWVTGLVENFAGYYFVARDAYEGAPGALPEVWRETFDIAREPGRPVIQHLLMGVNAHINCDLVLVLDDMLSPVWGDLGAAERAARYQDYCVVNAVIAETIDTVQDQVVAPYVRWMGLLDGLCGPLDEWCTERLIRNWRADVWRRAGALFAAEGEDCRRDLRRETDAAALRRVRLLVEGGEVGARVFGYPLRHLRRLRLA